MRRKEPKTFQVSTTNSNGQVQQARARESARARERERERERERGLTGTYSILVLFLPAPPPTFSNSFFIRSFPPVPAWNSIYPFLFCTALSYKLLFWQQKNPSICTAQACSTCSYSRAAWMHDRCRGADVCC
jgi:hypothetical protein